MATSRKTFNKRKKRVIWDPWRFLRSLDPLALFSNAQNIQSYEFLRDTASLVLIRWLQVMSTHSWDGSRLFRLFVLLVKNMTNKNVEKMCSLPLFCTVRARGEPPRYRSLFSSGFFWRCVETNHRRIPYPATQLTGSRPFTSSIANGTIICRTEAVCLYHGNKHTLVPWQGFKDNGQIWNNWGLLRD